MEDKWLYAIDNSFKQGSQKRFGTGKKDISTTFCLYCHRIIFLLQGVGVLYQALDYGYESESKTLIVQAVGTQSIFTGQPQRLAS